MYATFDLPLTPELASHTGITSVFLVEKTSIRRIRALNEEESATFEDAIGRLKAARNGDLILWAAERNWSEFSEALVEIVTAADIPGKSGDATLGLHLNRRLSNYLGMMRLYLDHEEKRISRAYGPGSDEFAKFKSVCAAAYDTHFSYRFSYRLRNYSLHHGFPIGHIKHRSQIDRTTNSVSDQIELFFEVDELLKVEKEIWGSLAPELRAKRPLLPVVETLDDLPEVVRSVRDLNREWERAHLRKAASVAVQSFGDAIRGPGAPHIGKLIDEAGFVGIDAEPFPLDLMRSLGIEDIDVSFNVTS